jgi:hypothetical protein
MDYNNYSDEQLFAILKQLPDFENLPLPKSWYDKFNLKMKKPETFRETLESNYALKCSFGEKDFPLEIKKTPEDYAFVPLVVDVVPLENKETIVESR